MRKPRILYFYPLRSTFVQRDIDILSQSFDLVTYDFHAQSPIFLPFQYLRQFVLLFLGIWKASGVVVQFSGHQALLPMLFARIWGKGSLIVVGGTDAASMPAIGYGNFRKRILGTVTCLSFRLAKHISPLHSSMIETDYTYVEDFPKKQGILAHCPKVKAPFTVIPNGYDPGHHKMRCAQKKRNSFMMAAMDLENPTITALKGLDLVLWAAARFPEGRFTVIGFRGEANFEVPPNVILVPPISVEELIDVESEHEFYLQLSVSEGFPNALCESMLCECIPIGSAVTSIPEIIGDSGFILEKRDPEKLLEILHMAVTSDKASLRKKARERIAQNYNWARRESQLTQLVNSII